MPTPPGSRAERHLTIPMDVVQTLAPSLGPLDGFWHCPQILLSSEGLGAFCPLQSWLTREKFTAGRHGPLPVKTSFSDASVLPATRCGGRDPHFSILAGGSDVLHKPVFRKYAFPLPPGNVKAFFHLKCVHGNLPNCLSNLFTL